MMLVPLKATLERLAILIAQEVDLGIPKGVDPGLEIRFV
eukprot:CAMPEP_0179484544 /NCGR_PEP_ID=MMETSP0799-20121207/61409_1 /TAXON_ID=46947 /ORGANISM="Geminigera cryophila, Strain CCMP2564" /LENGTH=38 /DNA_ID= /DNA_START= /DNA_END= /DNA_ORIENTATION=